MTPEQFFFYVFIGSIIVCASASIWVTKGWNDGGLAVIVLTGLGTGFLMAVTAISLAFNTTTTCLTSKIALVGGCDKNGVCAVKLENGSFTYASMAVIGHEVDVECKKHWKE